MQKFTISKDDFLAWIKPQVMTASYNRLKKGLSDPVELEGEPVGKIKEEVIVEGVPDLLPALVKDFNHLIKNEMPDTEAGTVAAALLILASAVTKK